MGRPTQTGWFKQLLCISQQCTSSTCWADPHRQVGSNSCCVYLSNAPALPVGQTHTDRLVQTAAVYISAMHQLYLLGRPTQTGWFKQLLCVSQQCTSSTRWADPHREAGSNSCYIYISLQCTSSNCWAGPHREAGSNSCYNISLQCTSSTCWADPHIQAGSNSCCVYISAMQVLKLLGKPTQTDWFNQLRYT